MCNIYVQGYVFMVNIMHYYNYILNDVFLCNSIAIANL